MKHTAMLVYSALAYIAGLACLAYLVGFLADFGVPKGISDGAAGPLWSSVLIDSALLLAFGLHHSLVARASFKRWWVRFVPPAIERATYLYMTAVTTGLLIWFWQPIPITLWHLNNEAASTAVTAAYLGTWITMFAATFHFGHFGFFGLRQAWDQFQLKPPGEASFAAHYLYAAVRHPISLGWMLMPWLTPHMTVGQLVWAINVIAYVVIATRFEEADLTEELGDDYRRYQSTVPRFVPGTK